MISANKYGKKEIPRLLLRGLDSLYVGFYLELPESLSISELVIEKEKIRERRDEFTEIALGSETFALMPYGKHPYQIVLVNKFAEIRLGPRIAPNCYVQFFSESLWQLGLDETISRFTLWLNSIGARKLRPESISRADWSFDFDLLIVDFDPDSFVTRATKDSAWREHRQLQTIQLGTGDCVVRLYDKIAEIEQQSAKAFFFDLWGQSKNVWRVEFQVRRPRLKKAGINNFQDLKDFQVDLLRELSGDHTRLCIPAGDSNRARWPLHPLWQSLTKAISSLPQTGLVADIEAAKGLKLRMFQQSRSLHGSLKGLATLLMAIERRPEPPSLQHVIQKLPHLLKEHHQSWDWDDDVKKRRQMLELGKW